MTPRDWPKAIAASFRRHPARTAVAVLALLVVAWAAWVVALGGVARVDASCGWCHSMRPYAHDAAPAHQTLTCGACHTGQTAATLVTDGLRMQRRLGSALLGRAPIAVSGADEGPCLSCHEAVLSRTVTANGIAVRHADFADVPCLECHAGTGHRLGTRSYSAAAMDDCLACHRTSSTNLDGCALCHVGGDGDREKSGSAWRVVHGPTWESTHGAGDLAKCRSCHPRDYCVRCHDTEIPHGAPWARDHGAAVVATGSTGCATCHAPDWCDRCHGVPMPHAKTFVATHPTQAVDVTDPACMRCHDVVSCETCHYLSAHPNVPGVDFFHGETER